MQKSCDGVYRNWFVMFIENWGCLQVILWDSFLRIGFYNYCFYLWGVFSIDLPVHEIHVNFTNVLGIDLTPVSTFEPVFYLLIKS